jgi:hypothetical protein
MPTHPQQQQQQQLLLHHHHRLRQQLLRNQILRQVLWFLFVMIGIFSRATTSRATTSSARPRGGLGNQQDIIA